MSDDILMLPLSMQCGGFIGALMLGAMLAFVFAVIKATRTVFHPSTAVTAAEDILYCIFSAAAVFAFLMRSSYGRLRWYIFAGVLLGWIIFKLTAGDMAAVLLAGVLKLIIGTAAVIFKIVFYPIKLIYGYIIEKITLFTEKLSFFIKKLCYKLESDKKEETYLSKCLEKIYTKE